MLRFCLFACLIVCFLYVYLFLYFLFVLFVYFGFVLFRIRFLAFLPVCMLILFFLFFFFFLDCMFLFVVRRLFYVLQLSARNFFDFLINSTTVIKPLLYTTQKLLSPQNQSGFWPFRKKTTICIILLVNFSLNTCYLNKLFLQIYSLCLLKNFIIFVIMFDVHTFKKPTYINFHFCVFSASCLTLLSLTLWFSLSKKTVRFCNVQMRKRTLESIYQTCWRLCDAYQIKEETNKN